MGDQPITNEEFKNSLVERYSYSSVETEDSKALLSIIELISKHQKNSVASFLLDCAMMISRQFEFREVCFGLKDNTDNLFKYGVILGSMPASQEALKKITYTLEDMTSETKYPGVKIGKFSQFLWTENPDLEQKTFNRPGLLRKNRTSLDEFIEGDYIDTYMYGGGDDLIGWVEIAGPKDGKILDKKKLIWLELVVSIIARIVWERMYRREMIMLS